MNTAKKSYKIILLLTALVMFVASAFCLFAPTSVNADSEKIKAIPSNYFSGIDSANLNVTENKLVATVRAGDSLSVKNELAVEDFSIDFTLPATVEEFSVIFTSDSYYVNGNKTVIDDETSFEKTITNKVTLTKNSDKYDAYLNGVSAGQLDSAVVSVKVVDGYFKFNGVEESAIAKRISHKEHATANVSFGFELSEGTDSAAITINSIDQKASDTEGKFKQSFATDTDGKIAVANPVVEIDAPVKVESGEITAFVSTEYDFSFNAYSVLGEVTKSDLCLHTEETDIFLTNTVDKPKTAVFQRVDDVDTFEIKVGEKSGDTFTKEYAKYDVKVIEKDSDTTAPVYNNDVDALESFRAALFEACYTTNSKGDKTNIALGTNIEIPSFEDLVSDDITPYEKMSYTVHYTTPDSSSTTSSLKFELTNDGDYYFYVIFKDASGNAMDEEMFIKEDDDGNFAGYGDYASSDDNEFKDDKYLFKFKILNDADITVKAAVKQGNGYKGVSYTASKFTIDASGCNTTYKLYYTADLIASKTSTWVEIPKASSITDVNYKEAYTYEEVQAIGYNGELTFTPDKIGTYKIECTATSNASSRYETATTFISVVEEPQIVKPANNWLRNNIWSVVFLSVGTLCLIGIVVLLCIKPKEETDNDEE